MRLGYSGNNGHQPPGESVASIDVRSNSISKHRLFCVAGNKASGISLQMLESPVMHLGWQSGFISCDMWLESSEGGVSRLLKNWILKRTWYEVDCYRSFRGIINEDSIMREINLLAEILDSPELCLQDTFIIAGYTNPAAANRHNEIWFLQRP